MIDAYEIGIELALQDGVSAGLEVVARELAALDAAVAASSAGLVALTRTAEQAAAAATVAAGGGGVVKAAVPIADAAVAALPAEGPVARDANSAAPEVRSVVVREVVPPAVVAAAAPVVGAQVGAAAPSSAARSPVEVVAGRPAPVVLPSAPVAAAAASLPVAADAGMSRRVDAPVVRAARVEAARVAVIENGSGGDSPRPARSGGTGGAERTTIVVAPDGGRGAAGEGIAPVAPRRAPEVRADILKARPAGVVAQGSAPRAERRWESGDGPRTAPTAPAPVAESRPVSAMAGLFPERAASPAREEGERGGTHGGTVMLDGRLVGHWLSDRMARDAARPGAGTTFFDPRQAPAWTPSGVL